MRLQLGFCLVAGLATASVFGQGQIVPGGLDKDKAIASAGTNVVLKIGLVDCIAWTLKRNPDVAIRRLDPLIRGKDVEAAKGAFHPALSAEATVSANSLAIPLPGGGETNTVTDTTDLKAGISGRLTPGTRYTVEMVGQEVDKSPASLPLNPAFTVAPRITVTQPLFRGAGTTVNRAEIVIAARRQEMSRQDVVKSIVDAISRTQVGYYVFCYSRDIHALASAALTRAEDLLKINRERYAKGLISSVDLLETEAAVAQRQKALIASESAVEKASDALKLLVNLVEDPVCWNARIEPLDRPGIEVRSVELSLCLANAFRNRPDYQAKRMEMDLRDIQLDVARNAAYPAVDLVGSYGLNGMGADSADALSRISADQEGWMAGVRVSIPWGSPDSARRDQKEMEKEQALMELKRLEQNIVLEVRDRVREVDIQRRQVEAARLAFEKESENYRAQKERYRGGQVSTHDLIEYQERLAGAEADHLKAITDYQTALVNVDQAEGATLSRHNIVLEE